jgi:hypothetical protein
MPQTQIQVAFDPSGDEKSRFSFAPVRSSMDNETRSVEMVLSTRGGAGPPARFAEPRGIRWTGPFAGAEEITDQGPEVPGLTETPDSSRTRLRVEGFPENDTDHPETYEYVVTVDYDGKTYSSRPGYPSTTCVPTGGGGG